MIIAHTAFDHIVSAVHGIVTAAFQLGIVGNDFDLRLDLLGVLIPVTMDIIHIVLVTFAEDNFVVLIEGEDEVRFPVGREDIPRVHLAAVGLTAGGKERRSIHIHTDLTARNIACYRNDTGLGKLHIARQVMFVLIAGDFHFALDRECSIGVETSGIGVRLVGGDGNVVHCQVTFVRHTSTTVLGRSVESDRVVVERQGALVINTCTVAGSILGEGTVIDLRRDMNRSITAVGETATLITG